MFLICKILNKTKFQRSFEDSIDTFLSLFDADLMVKWMNNFRHGFRFRSASCPVLHIVLIISRGECTNKQSNHSNTEISTGNELNISKNGTYLIESTNNVNSINEVFDDSQNVCDNNLINNMSNLECSVGKQNHKNNSQNQQEKRKKNQ